MKRGGLGRGLDVLLPQSGELLETVVRDISIDEIDPNASQPRRDFDKEALEQLADSIREAGVLSPILVVENGMRYRIVAGERRYRAARLAGLETVPCIVRSMTNEQQMEAALIENLQRQDLNPIEEAQGYQQLMTDYGMTQELAAERVGKSRPAVANALRLLSLCPAVLELVEQGRLSAGHARALLAIKSAPEQYAVAMKVINLQLSVRQTENMCKNLTKKPKQEQPKPIAVDYIAECEKTLSKRLSRGVRIVNGKRKGRVELEYYGEEDLQQLYELLERLGERRSGRYE